MECLEGLLMPLHLPGQKDALLAKRSTPSQLIRFGESSFPAKHNLAEFIAYNSHQRSSVFCCWPAVVVSGSKAMLTALLTQW